MVRTWLGTLFKEPTRTPLFITPASRTVGYQRMMSVQIQLAADVTEEGSAHILGRADDAERQ